MVSHHFCFPHGTWYTHTHTERDSQGERERGTHTNKGREREKMSVLLLSRYIELGGCQAIDISSQSLVNGLFCTMSCWSEREREVCVCKGAFGAYRNHPVGPTLTGVWALFLTGQVQTEGQGERERGHTKRGCERRRVIPLRREREGHREHRERGRRKGIDTHTDTHKEREIYIYLYIGSRLWLSLQG